MKYSYGCVAGALAAVFVGLLAYFISAFIISSASVASNGPTYYRDLFLSLGISFLFAVIAGVAGFNFGSDKGKRRRMQKRKQKKVVRNDGDMNWKKAILVGLIAFVITFPLSWFYLENWLWILPGAYRDTRILLVLIPLIFSSLIGVAWSIKPPKGELPISNWLNALLGMALFLIFSCGFHMWIIGQGEQAGLAFLVTIPLTLVVFPFSALGGVLGAWIAFRFRKTKASKAVVIIGATVGGILVIILSAILFYIAFS